MCVSTDPVVAPLESEAGKGENLEPEKDEDVGITFVARKTSETPKTRPKSGKRGRPTNNNIMLQLLFLLLMVIFGPFVVYRDRSCKFPTNKGLYYLIYIVLKHKQSHF